MGLDVPDLFKYLPSDISVECNDFSKIVLPPRNPRYSSPENTLYIPIDTEGFLYKLNFNDPTKHYIFQNIVEALAKMVHFLLDKPPGTEGYDEIVVDLRCDLSTPPNKALTRKADATTPDTPRSKDTDDPVVSWYNEFCARHTLRSSHSEFDAKRALLFDMPRTKAQINKLKETGQDVSGLVEWGAYLKNPHFKRFVNRILFENILSYIDFNNGRKGFVLARSPSVAEMKSPTERGPIPRHLSYDYDEADNAVAILSVKAKHPLKPNGRLCDVFVISTSSDGDICLSLLAASNIRIKRRGATTEDYEWLNSVTFRRSSTYYNINTVYIRLIEAVKCVMHPGIRLSNPILSAFVPLLIANSGSCDYVSKGFMPKIGAGFLLKSFFLFCNYICQEMIESHVIAPDRVIVHANKLAILIAGAYRIKHPSLDIPFDDYPKAKSLLDAAGIPAPTVEQVRILAAQASWTLTYYTASSYGRCAPDPFQLSPKGLSLWGYQKQDSKEHNGRFTVTHPEDVDGEELVEISQSILRAAKTSPRSITNKHGLQPLSPDSKS